MQTKAEKEQYLHMIKHGYLDIVVGTHALLGSRVMYNNLGLLVVDEEQRFGVKQKEQIASFKTSVDVLTLSATPIPRTLYLALTGFRDASLISTPPPQRVPIRTHLSAYKKQRVISAIEYELDRGGQVFYVLPRIKGLEEVMEFLRLSFPDVEVAMAHGKQYSKQLEETMEKFARGEIKILICTNIVESGLDIQNANTIIVQDVHHFGLAQLYQVYLFMFILLPKFLLFEFLKIHGIRRSNRGNLSLEFLNTYILDDYVARTLRRSSRTGVENFLDTDTVWTRV